MVSDLSRSRLNNSAFLFSRFLISFKRLFLSSKYSKRDISYVSGAQITPALYEGLFVAAGNYVKNEKNKTIEFDYNDFPEKMWKAIFREFDKQIFSQKIAKETFVKFTFQVVGVETMGSYYVFNFKFSGPVRGFAKCVVPA